MTILDQLIEKKDILAYCDARMVQITKDRELAINNAKDTDKQYIIKKFAGRMEEIQLVKHLAKQKLFASKSKEVWGKYPEECKHINR